MFVIKGIESNDIGSWVTRGVALEQTKGQMLWNPAHYCTSSQQALCSLLNTASVLASKFQVGYFVFSSASATLRGAVARLKGVWLGGRGCTPQGVMKCMFHV